MPTEPKIHGRVEHIWPELALAVREWARDPLPKFPQLTVEVRPDPFLGHPELVALVHMTEGIYNASKVISNLEGACPPPEEFGPWITHILDDLHMSLVRAKRRGI